MKRGRERKKGREGRKKDKTLVMETHHLDSMSLQQKKEGKMWCLAYTLYEMADAE